MLSKSCRITTEFIFVTFVQCNDPIVTEKYANDVCLGVNHYHEVDAKKKIRANMCHFLESK